MSTLSGQKRPLPSKESDGSDEEITVNGYSGYTFPATERLELDRVDPTMNPTEFFDRYVSQRRPCILTGLPDGVNGKSLHVTPDTLVQVAGDCNVQVEKRPDANQHFGQSRTAERQVVWTVKDLVERLRGPDREHYYLSTQQMDAEDDKQKQRYPVPCRQLLDKGHILSSLPLAGNLILQSCNIWMGAAVRSASGLHHDYHDNFYLLLSGRKQFRLYAPADAEKMSVYGSIQRIHHNGLISYESNPSRADGTPLVDEGKDGNDDDDDNDDDNDGDNQEASVDDSEEEVVLGKGFDYRSDSDEEGDEAFGGQEVDDYDDFVAAEDEASAGGDSKSATDHNPGHPDHFSSVDPTNSKLSEEYPDFKSCRECIVDLDAGQCLYLPAGWFHFVTSSCESKNPHLALNYWYHPPDQLDRFGVPYRKGYWKRRQAGDTVK
jgi:hypothetical protein